MSDGLNQLQSILSALPRAVIVVMRYLFAFLNQYVHFLVLMFIYCRMSFNIYSLHDVNVFWLILL